MATGADVRDILELTGGENDGPISKKDLINSDKVRFVNVHEARHGFRIFRIIPSVTNYFKWLIGHDPVKRTIMPFLRLCFYSVLESMI